MENSGRKKQTTCEVKMTETLGQNQGNWASVSVYGGGIQVIQVWEIQPSWVNVTWVAPACINFSSNLEMTQNDIFAALFLEFCQGTENQGFDRM